MGCEVGGYSMTSVVSIGIGNPLPGVLTHFATELSETLERIGYRYMTSVSSPLKECQRVRNLAIYSI
jgi:hypothetical protein